MEVPVDNPLAGRPVSPCNGEKAEPKSNPVVGASQSEEGAVGRRRLSARLQKKEKPFYGNQKATGSAERKAPPERKAPQQMSVDRTISKKRARMDMKLASQASSSLPCDEAARVVNEVEANGVASEEGGLDPSIQKSAHARVKDTLRIFNNYYLHFVQVRLSNPTHKLGFWCFVLEAIDVGWKLRPCLFGF